MLLILSLLACRTDGPTQPIDSVAPVGDVSWHADIKPLLDKHCVRCHTDGGQGPGDFSDRATAESFSGVMIAKIQAGEMPPPASDPDCRDYVASDELNLSAPEQAVFEAWVDQGLPQGDEADAPELEVVETRIPDPDLTAFLEAPYTPAFERDGNEYRCFWLDPGHTEDTYITGMAPEVDKDAIVHHIVLMTADRAQVEALDSPAEGFDCYDGFGDDSGAINNWLAAWAPGMQPIRFPADSGMKLGADEVMMMQVHYYQAEDGLADQTGFHFETSSSASTEIFMANLGSYDFSIPAGDESYTAGDSYPLPVDVQVYGVFPHMHVLGSGYDMRAGDECLVSSDKYRFANQMTYQFIEPLQVSAGDDLSWECTWNNSTSNPDLINNPPVTTGWGEATDEEMCFFFTYFSL